MILYHFTSPDRLAMIQGAGFIRATESNIGSNRQDWPPFGEHAGPDVVWLTDEPEPRSGGVLGLDLQLDGTDKMGVRLTVDVPDREVAWWPDFRAEHGINRQWRRALEVGRDPQSWWVITRPVLMPEIVGVHFADLVEED